MRDDMATDPIALDLETNGHPHARRFLEPVIPDKRIKDPAKIEIDRIEREQARWDKLALDPNVAVIVALGYWTRQSSYVVTACKNELEETAAIAHFWRACLHRAIVGFNIKGFDLRFLVQRSRYLGVPHPVLDFSPYSSRSGISDLFLTLTFNDGIRDQGAMRRTLKAFCRRFGMTVADPINGEDIPALVAAGKWEQIVMHCLADLELTVQLAQRLGVIATVEAAEVL